MAAVAVTEPTLPRGRGQSRTGRNGYCRPSAFSYTGCFKELAIKAITIRQPFASMIMSGEKLVENRGWSVKPQRIVIHAAKQPPIVEAVKLPKRAAKSAGKSNRNGAKPSTADMAAILADFPCGVALGTVTIGVCERTRDLLADADEEMFLQLIQMGLDIEAIDGWAWRLDDPLDFPEPIPLKGKLGLFEFPDELFPGKMEDWL